DGIIHYCVANMPGAVARTSAFALSDATLPFALKIANLGLDKALAQDPDLKHGLNVSNGKLRHKAVAEALELEYDPAYGWTALGLLSDATPCSTSGRQLTLGG